MANTAVETTEARLEHELSAPQRLMQFLRETRAEMRKVVTPTRAEVQSNTLIVIVTVFLFAAFFEAVDLIFGKGLDKFFLKITHH
jgi:preprotein translocase subunit SecE